MYINATKRAEVVIWQTCPRLGPICNISAFPLAAARKKYKHKGWTIALMKKRDRLTFDEATGVWEHVAAEKVAPK